LINKTTKRKLLRLITKRKDYLGNFTAYDGLLSFLDRIWPLRSLPSIDDDRWTNMYDNIVQHCVNNNDWTDDVLYEQMLNLIDGEDQYFTAFLETVVSPETRVSQEDIMQYAALINAELAGSRSDMRLILSDYFEKLPVYRLREYAQYRDLPPA